MTEGLVLPIFQQSYPMFKGVYVILKKNQKKNIEYW